MPTPLMRVLLSGIPLAAAIASPASAEPKTRLVPCETGDCLLVTGHRADAKWAININGHRVAVEGARNWRVRVPVETVRRWSAPFARSITVSAVDGDAQTHAIVQTDLPIGLLGHAENLAMLVVRLK